MFNLSPITEILINSITYDAWKRVEVVYEINIVSSTNRWVFVIESAMNSNLIESNRLISNMINICIYFSYISTSEDAQSIQSSQHYTIMDYHIAIQTIVQIYPCIDFYKCPQIASTVLSSQEMAISISYLYICKYIWKDELTITLRSSTWCSPQNVIF